MRLPAERARILLLCVTCLVAGLVVGYSLRPAAPKPGQLRDLRDKNKEEVRATLGEPAHTFRPPNMEPVTEVWQFDGLRPNGAPVFVHFDRNGKVVKVY